MGEGEGGREVDVVPVGVGSPLVPSGESCQSLVVRCQTGRGRGTASGQQQGRRGVGGRGVAFDDFGRGVGGSRHIALNVNGRIVRRRLGAAVEDEGRHEEDEQTAGGGVKGAPAFVEAAEVVAEAVGEEKREERGRAEEAKGHQELLDEDWSVHFEFTIFDLRLTNRELDQDRNFRFTIDEWDVGPRP